MKKFKKVMAMSCAAIMAVSAMSVSAFAEEIIVMEHLPFVEGEVEVVYKDISTHSCTDKDGNVIPAEHLYEDGYEITPFVTIYETENNGTIATADQTYSNYDNVGALSTAGDEDFWKITFDETGTGVGSANFWLGNVPSNCNYRLTIYEQNGGNRYTAYPVDVNGDGGQELLENFDVFTGLEYYIRVDSAQYDKSSSQYLMRARQL